MASIPPATDPPGLVAAVRSILSAPPIDIDRDVPAALRDISKLRSAAVRVLEDDADPQTKAAVIRRVFRAAGTAELADWAIEAVQLEIDDFFAAEPRPRHESVVGAARRLKRNGFGACPICRQSVLVESECRSLENQTTAWVEYETAKARRIGGAA